MQRCKAKSKRSKEQCKNFALRGFKVCRMHGARGGPKTLEGRRHCKIVSLKHRFYSKESCVERQQLSNLFKRSGC